MTGAPKMAPTAPALLSQIDGFDIFVVGADIADMGKGEGDDLRGVGRVGENFLIAGHGGVEADFADRVAQRAERQTPSITSPLGENEHAGVDGFRPAVISTLVDFRSQIPAHVAP